MSRSHRRPAAAALAAALLSIAGLAHEGDPKVLDLVPPYRGPGFRSGEPRVLRGGAFAAAPALFPASGVQLLSWLPLSELDGGISGNSCYGYTSPSGREYALMGVRSGTSVVEISDPGDPEIVALVSGPHSLWRDVRTYQSYAYMVSEGGDGIQVVDLSGVDAGVVTYVGNVVTGGTLATHTLFIDQTSGFLYRSGGSQNGLRIYSLANPASPSLVATWTDRYVHEVTVVSYSSGPYAGKQIAFCCGGFNGGFSQTGVSILDVTNKQDIKVLKHFSYPGAAYCHQAWPSQDLKYLYIDDELDEDGTIFTSTKVVDISNLSNPVVKTPFANQSTAIGHNLYVRGNRIYEANYKSGLRVFDSTNPLAPVEIAWFDTWPEDEEASFSGLWNNYPYFQSGVVIGSDINKGLFVWWVGAPLLDISYPGGVPVLFDPVGAQLTVQIAEQTPGTLVTGSERLHYDLGSGWVSVQLSSLGGGLYSGAIPSTGCGALIHWYVSARSSNGITWTDPQGGPLIVHDATAALSQSLVLADDLETPGAWDSGAPGDDATEGKWIHGDPYISVAQPDDDHTPGTAIKCWFTKQTWAGATPGAHDVDGGHTSLTSPPLDLSGLSVPMVSYWRWFSNDQGNNPSEDTLEVRVSASASGPWVTVETVGPAGPGSSGGWIHHQFLVSDYLLPGAGVLVRFVASDTGGDSLVEAAIDDLEVLDLGCLPGGPAVYCTAKLNSQGCVPQIGYSGIPSASSPVPFDVTASSVLNNQNGVLFYGFGPDASAFQGGTLCVAPPLTRTGLLFSGGNPPPDDCSGAHAFDFNALIQSGADPALVGGAQVHAQYWTRDPLDPTGFGTGLTDALQFTIQP